MEEEKVEVVRKLREVVFQSSVPAKKVAKELGVDYTQLSMMCSEESLKKGKPKFPLVLLPKLIRVTGRHDLMEELSKMAGGIYTRVDNIEIDGLDDLIEVRNLLQEVTKLIDTYVSAHRDGVITDEEIREIQEQITRVLSSIFALETHTAIIYL